MFVIKCPNFRPKKVEKKHFDRAKCNHVLGFIYDLHDKDIVLKCPTCHTYHRLTIKDQDPELTLIDKEDLEFNNILAYKTNGYQSKVF